MFSAFTCTGSEPSSAEPGPWRTCQAGVDVQCIYLYRERAFFSRAWPLADLPPTAWKPLMFKALRAFCTAAVLLETRLPVLLLVSLSLVRPPTVFILRPEKTARA